MPPSESSMLQAAFVDKQHLLMNNFVDKQSFRQQNIKFVGIANMESVDLESNEKLPHMKP